MKTEVLIRVVLPYACYGVVVRGSRIVDAAPIARWAIGKPLAQFRSWVISKGGMVEDGALIVTTHAIKRRA